VTFRAERRRLLRVAARLARRRAWWTVSRDRAAARLAELDRELSAADAAIAELDRLEAGSAEPGR
jgi:hypothetical protein